jgi:hypothetical protein
MDSAVWAMLGVVAASVVAYVINPWVQARLKKQQENDPALGWKMAVSSLETRVTALEEENLELEAKVATLQTQVVDKTAVIARQDGIIRDQSRIIEACQARVAQLEALWRTRFGEPPPVPDPAVAYWLGRAVLGGNH